MGGTTPIVSGHAIVGGIYNNTNGVAAGSQEWMHQAAIKYNAGFWQVEGLLENESGIQMNPVYATSSGEKSNFWGGGGGVSFLLGAPSYKPGNNVAAAGTQSISFLAWYAEETAKVNLSPAVGAGQKTSVTPTLLQLGADWQYHFTPNFWYTAGIGFAWNNNGSGYQMTGSTGGVEQNGNSWQANTGFDFWF